MIPSDNTMRGLAHLLADQLDAYGITAEDIAALCDDDETMARVARHITALVRPDDVSVQVRIDSFYEATYPSLEGKLPDAIVSALRNEGVRDIGLLQVLSVKNLLGLRGLGIKRVEEIHAFLAAENGSLRLREEKENPRLRLRDIFKDPSIVPVEYMYTVQELSHGLVQILNDKQLQMLRHVGIRRLGDFAWASKHDLVRWLNQPPPGSNEQLLGEVTLDRVKGELHYFGLGLPSE